MKKLFWSLAGVLMVFGAAVPAFSQETAGAVASAPLNVAALAAGFGMAIASGLCGLAQGKATAAAAEGMARNPGATAGIRLALILGLAFIESLALYTFVIIFIKV
jgi:F-type H+-transporting ATPase subunit c